MSDGVSVFVATGSTAFTLTLKPNPIDGEMIVLICTGAFTFGIAANSGQTLNSVNSFNGTTLNGSVELWWNNSNTTWYGVYNAK